MGQDPGRIGTASARHAETANGKTPDQQRRYGEDYRRHEEALGDVPGGKGSVRTTHAEESCPQGRKKEDRYQKAGGEGSTNKGGKKAGRGSCVDRIGRCGPQTKIGLI